MATNAQLQAEITTLQQRLTRAEAAIKTLQAQLAKVHKG